MSATVVKDNDDENCSISHDSVDKGNMISVIQVMIHEELWTIVMTRIPVKWAHTVSLRGKAEITGLKPFKLIETQKNHRPKKWMTTGE
ncbi:hypothetical protein DPMN_024705 [Dreissena polymorpha]|uniref:Uncharacterized protein n=1 Tax=Dreissena polymorpha TaxID=45954 RepID=A0A9D4LMY3_DREPO|nr:hypothetical protein DPMN_024705 [Dreissena polymorpha]